MLSKQSPLIDMITGRVIDDLSAAKVFVSKNGSAFAPRSCVEPLRVEVVGDEHVLSVPLSAADTDTEGVLCVRVDEPRAIPSIGVVTARE